MNDETICYNCRFFSPGQYGCAPYDLPSRLGEFEEDNEGLCRRHTPRHGETITRPNGDEFICFAEWPKVMACDWCGEFESRTQHHNCANRNCANCNKAKGDCE
jgi:hypothetical protein